MVVRRTSLGMEFWLKSDQERSRWAFPDFLLVDHSDHHKIVHHIQDRWHLKVLSLASKPVATLPRSRNEDPGVIKAYVFQYLGKQPEATGPLDFRYRWCLLEEAQRRIRRKPLQRIVQDVHRQFSDQVPLFDSP
ncbi:hypothetical protein C5Y96_21775 [Blastopirellula marina]|uniref:Uncharacterized protein n=1 Tax=Blastopirellula marina TaxID=124 RepID=A0A2S8F1M8_9BACT|nr:hypothetical protein C5Y96_21775 [Blastopirellula marina]RCS44440.1 hypothetical protein DTL36_21820 [Bremerella cremea]